MFKTTLSSFHYGLLIVAIIVAVIPQQTSGACWDTGCQLHSWAVKGCQQYGMVETRRRGCNGGTIYSCCHGSGGGGSSSSGGGGGGGERHGDLTYYNLGLTACGRVYSNSDFVAALAFGHFTTANPNRDPMCGRRARITDPATGKSVVVTISDKCQACKMNDIDVSPAAFKQLGDLGRGRFRVKWSFV